MKVSTLGALIGGTLGIILVGCFIAAWEDGEQERHDKLCASILEATYRASDVSARDLWRADFEKLCVAPQVSQPQACVDSVTRADAWDHFSCSPGAWVSIEGDHAICHCSAVRAAPSGPVMPGGAVTPRETIYPLDAGAFGGFILGSCDSGFGCVNVHKVEYR